MKTAVKVTASGIRKKREQSPCADSSGVAARLNKVYKRTSNCLKKIQAVKKRFG